MDVGKRTVLWLWWLGCSCWNFVWKWVKLIWRSLRAWWLVTKIRIDENPVTEGLILVALFVAAGFMWVAGNHDVELGDLPSFFKDITVNKVANPWRDAIKVRLFDKKIQSPIGDYLALEVVVLFLGKLVEKLLQGVAIPTQGLSPIKVVTSLARRALMAVLLLVNIVVTGLISYGFLWPLPPEFPIMVLYIGLTVFMFVVGFGGSVLSIIKAFPVTPELVRNSVMRRRIDGLMLSVEEEKRRIVLRSKISNEDEIVVPAPRQSCFLEWDLVERRPTLSERLKLIWETLRQRGFEDPRNSLMFWVAVAWFVVRFGVWVCVVFVIWLTARLSSPVVPAKLFALWTGSLIVLGVINSALIRAVYFRGYSWIKRILVSLSIMFGVALWGLLMHELWKCSKGGCGVSNVDPALSVVLSLLLFVVEWFCVFLVFELRDPTLVTLVRKRRSLEYETRLLCDYFRKHFPTCDVSLIDC